MEPPRQGELRAPRASGRSRQARVKAYQAMGAAWGLASMLADEDPHVALRVFILDNSGSTSQSDGHVLEKDSRGQFRSVQATRWEEICATALDQAAWNARGGVRTDFILLNPPCPQDPAEGRDFVTVDPNRGNATEQVKVLAQVLRCNGPRGTTPLTQRLLQLDSRLQREVRDGRRIVLSIVTDGLPTSPHSGDCTDRDKNDFIAVLRRFTVAFNSFVVIRLATDSDSTVEFYNKIDDELELPLDILDDLEGEAKEVNACGNGWLAYSPLIHRIREGGTMEKLFDLLDERPLKGTAIPSVAKEGFASGGSGRTTDCSGTPEEEEITKLLEFVLPRAGDTPLPRDPAELFKVATEIVAEAPLVYNGRLGRMTPPVNLKQLKKSLGQNSLQRLKALPGRMVRALFH
uniref:VWFA domain-containing protein n=1 Tax=Alexandrium monilatum TaxID=311494 RepID=A0A7S4UII3_9DINO